MDEREAMLTTIDNPWNPFTNFDEWYAFDIAAGHHSCELLARFSLASFELSDADNHVETNRAIDEILKHDPEHIYKRVYKDEINS